MYPQIQSSRGSPDRLPKHSHEAPRYLNRDRDTSYVAVVIRRLRTMGILRPADHATLAVAETVMLNG
jgi:hypothetical protein